MTQNIPSVDACWNSICAYMHHGGENFGDLTSSQIWEVYCLGDGFGKMTPNQLLYINDGWDWSHIRDSSDEATIAMAMLIKKFVEG